METQGGGIRALLEKVVFAVDLAHEALPRQHLGHFRGLPLHPAAILLGFGHLHLQQLTHLHARMPRVHSEAHTVHAHCRNEKRAQRRGEVCVDCVRRGRRSTACVRVQAV